MNGENARPLNSLAENVFYIALSFQPNGTGAPSLVRQPKGFNATVQRTGVGLFTVTLDPQMNIPTGGPIYWDSNPQAATLGTDWFDTVNIGDFNPTTRQFTIQAHRSGVAQEVAGTTGNRISMSMFFRNSTAA